jgi:hypothetical protein
VALVQKVFDNPICSAEKISTVEVAHTMQSQHYEISRPQAAPPRGTETGVNSQRRKLNRSMRPRTMGSTIGGLLGDGDDDKGGGGGIFGAIGGIAGGIFGGPVGAAIGSGIGGLLDGAFSADEVKPGVQNQANDTIGGAVTGAAQQLAQNHGMPQFLADEISSAVQTVVGGMQQPTAPGVDEHVQNCCGQQFAGSKDELIQTLVSAVMDALEGKGAGKAGGADAANEAGGADEASGGYDFEADQAKLNETNVKNGKEFAESTDEAQPSKSKGKHSSGSWLQAMAKAMGGALGEKAAKMVELSNGVAKHTKASDAMKKDNADKNFGKGKAGEKAEKKATAAQQDEASKATQMQTELQGVTQELNMMTQAFSTAIKGIGEALGTLGRKG